MPFKSIQEGGSQGRCFASCEGSWCKGKKAEKLLGSGSLCYLSYSCLGQIHKDAVPRGPGVSVQIRSRSRRRQSQRGDRGRQTWWGGESWSRAPSPSALPALSFYPRQGSAPCPGTFQVPGICLVFLFKQGPQRGLFQTTSGCRSKWLPPCQLAMLPSQPARGGRRARPAACRDAEAGFGVNAQGCSGEVFRGTTSASAM